MPAASSLLAVLGRVYGASTGNGGSMHVCCRVRAAEMLFRRGHGCMFLDEGTRGFCEGLAATMRGGGGGGGGGGW